MRYSLTHRTKYKYEGAVSVSHHLARLAPRFLPGQRCPWHTLEITPEPVGRSLHNDVYGNVATYFECEGKHKQLEVVAKSLVEVLPMALPDPQMTPAWEEVRKEVYGDKLTISTEAGAFRFSSPMVPLDNIFAEYAADDFPPGRPILQGVMALTHRIFDEFEFDPKATDVATLVTEALRKRAGVCQDFAHVMLACLRSLGLPARYVSGYLETQATCWAGEIGGRRCFTRMGLGLLRREVWLDRCGPDKRRSSFGKAYHSRLGSGLFRRQPIAGCYTWSRWPDLEGGGRC